MVSRYHFTFKETLDAIFGNNDSELEELEEEASGSESQRNNDVLFGQIRLSSWFTERHRYEKQHLDMPVELKTFSCSSLEQHKSKADKYLSCFALLQWGFAKN